MLCSFIDFVKNLWFLVSKILEIKDLMVWVLKKIQNFETFGSKSLIYLKLKEPHVLGFVLFF